MTMEWTEKDRIALKLAAGLLDYPGSPGFVKNVEDRMRWAASNPSLRDWMVRYLESRDRIAYEEDYVRTFDLSDHGSLYLTAHEMGDSRDRGQALIELRNLLNRFGYGVPERQLSDFLPLVLEFLAVVTDDPEVVADEALSKLAVRAGVVVSHLLGRIDPDHLYYPVLDALREVLPIDSEQVSQEVLEQPDLSELPYPMHYE